MIRASKNSVRKSSRELLRFLRRIKTLAPGGGCNLAQTNATFRPANFDLPDLWQRARGNTRGRTRLHVLSIAGGKPARRNSGERIKGRSFYATELIEGETLEDRVRRAGPLNARTTIGIAEQVTPALAAAEKHGLVHRHLKPANLMLINADDPEVMKIDQARSKRSKIRALRKGGIPVVKIIDFGLAKAFHTATDPKSLTHDRFVGTPAFASPEQFDHSALDVRSDIYSLGETLWFALTGKTPFAGQTLSEIHRAQKSDVLPTEQLKAAHVPHRLKSLLESMLAFEPALRPGTRELAGRLQRCSPEARSIRRTRVALAVAAIALAVAACWIVWKSEFIRHP